MQLYKDYKEECYIRNKEQEDREKLGISSEVTVIYEPTKTMTMIRSLFNVLLLIGGLLIIGGGVIAMVLYVA